MEKRNRLTTDEMLRLLLEQMTDFALILVDAEGQVVDWFAGAEQIFGYSAEEMRGRSLRVLFTPEDNERGISELELRIASSDGSAQDDRWQVRKDGMRIWASGMLMPLRDAAGNVVGFAKLLRNRTDLRERLETLENRVAALKAVDERRNVLMGTVAHELRNSLGPLLLQLAMLESADTAPLKPIERQIDLLRRLIEDLLDLTRLRTGKFQLQLTSIDLRDVLRQVAASRQPVLGQRRHRFQLLLPDAVMPVEADAVRLEQVTGNLLDNAIKFTPDGGDIWLKATIEEDQAVFRVRDSGVGISAEMLPQVFELFTQDAVSLDRSSSGLGIGLSVVKELVTLHGGSVEVRSDGRDKGSEFTVRLPLSQ